MAATVEFEIGFTPDHSFLFMLTHVSWFTSTIMASVFQALHLFRL